MPRDHGHLPAPTVGDRVSATGAYVEDTEHDWAELHPVWSLSINGGPVHRSGPQYGGSPAAARSHNAESTCHTNTGGQCVGYGASSAPTTSGGGGGRASTAAPGSSSASAPSPGGATQIVHPGAFCSPEGARGVTSDGTPMTCKTSATDARDRWRRSG
jgi:hypothetical protein